VLQTGPVFSYLHVPIPQLPPPASPVPSKMRLLFVTAKKGRKGRKNENEKGFKHRACKTLVTKKGKEEEKGKKKPPNSNTGQRNRRGSRYYSRLLLWGCLLTLKEPRRDRSVFRSERPRQTLHFSSIGDSSTAQACSAACTPNLQSRDSKPDREVNTDGDTGVAPVLHSEPSHPPVLPRKETIRAPCVQL